MLDTVKGISYKAFGLMILSEISLPELPQINKTIENIDVVIEIDGLTEVWNKHNQDKKHLIATDDGVLMKIPNAAVFYIQAGKRIIVSPLKDYDEDAIRLYLLGSCMGIILMQRKILPLHGSAVAIDGKAYAFIGESGAGKSTLAAAFMNKGYELLTDDIVAISFKHNQIPIVTPAYPHQKLWKQSLQAFGMESNQYRPIFQRETKYSVPVSSQFHGNELPLGGIFELVKGNCGQIAIQPIKKLKRLQTLFLHTYRNFLITRLNLMEWHFNVSTNLINRLPMYRLQRNTLDFTAHELVTLVLNTIHEEASVK
ncbi:aldolase [Bacillus cereus]|nr:aldolase [Bacillus cereus]PFN75168.1 aldolase [Bacillus cereus]